MLKILVVDDEVPIRQWLEFCINKISGFQVVGAAAHGAEGYSLYRKNMPDIVITDIRMPVMDGLEMMKMIQNLNPSVYTIVLTSHEDFGYARQAISLGAAEYILKTEISDLSLKEVLNKAARVIGKPSSGSEQVYEDISNRNHILRTLVLKNQPMVLSETMLKEYAIPLKNQPFYAIDVMTDPGITDKVHRPDMEFLEHMVKFPVDVRHTMIVGNIAGSCPVSQSRILESCREYCGRIMEEIPCRIGVSDLYDKRGQLLEAMIQAYRRTQTSFYHPRERIYMTQTVTECQPGKGEKYKILFSKELVNQNFFNAVAIKNQMMEEIRREEPSDTDYVKSLYLFFVTSLLHITKDDVDKVERELKIMTEELNACETLDQLDQEINRIFEEHGYHESRNQEYSHAVRGAIGYMEEHYAQPITQTEVAGHVGLSSEYLSRIFKEETGVKFVVYLNNLRLKHALRLLESTNMKVYEVAEQVGYSNLSYFSTVFKKNFGQNPFDYKNNYVNNG